MQLKEEAELHPPTYLYGEETVLAFREMLSQLQVGEYEKHLSKTENDTFPWFLFLFYVKNNFEIFCGYIYYTARIQDVFM